MFSSSFMTLLVPIMAFCGSQASAFMMSPDLCSHQSRSRYIHTHLGYDQTKQFSHTLGLFGFGDTTTVEEAQTDLQDDELARFSHVLSSGANPTVKFDSLSIMISEWSKLFADKERKMGLTTPVVVVELKPLTSTLDDEDINNYTGVQLLFKKGKTGGRSAYHDKDEERYDSEKKERREEEGITKEGGVEVRVEQLASGNLRVVASRCDFDEDTIAKEMSEQTIVDSLRKAMTAWKKEQSSYMVTGDWS
ncbi:hypothetical protein ACHAXR_006664 [Thalassiosira sp. AJA248-18]